MNHKDFGPRLRKIRRSRMLTQTDVSSKLNISRQAYSNYEQGRCMPPSNIVADLSIILNANLFLLFIQDAQERQNIQRPDSYAGEVSTDEIESLVDLYSQMPLEKRMMLLNHIIPGLSEREV